VTSAKAKETKMGRTIACHGIEVVLDEDKCEMMAAITKPVISSMRAALINMEPTLVCRIDGSRRERVVPTEVEHNAAPAANDWSGEYPYPKWSRRSDKAIGRNTPVMATVSDMRRLL
jgi:hypothetical protein